MPTPEAEVKPVYGWQKQLLKMANLCKSKVRAQAVTLVVIFEADGCVRFSPSTGDTGGRVCP